MNLISANNFSSHSSAKRHNAAVKSAVSIIFGVSYPFCNSFCKYSVKDSDLRFRVVTIVFLM